GRHNDVAATIAIEVTGGDAQVGPGPIIAGIIHRLPDAIGGAGIAQPNRIDHDIRAPVGIHIRDNQPLPPRHCQLPVEPALRCLLQIDMHDVSTEVVKQPLIAGNDIEIAVAIKVSEFDVMKYQVIYPNRLPVRIAQPEHPRVSDNHQIVTPVPVDVTNLKV